MAKGVNTRKRIVDHATRRARTIGLEGLTLGTLASDLSLSKSGLFAHFRSKEDLQLAVLDRAAEQLTLKVIRPAIEQPEGEPRVRALFERYLDWAEREGGCPIVAFSSEMDDRPGPVRNRIVKLTRQLLRFLAGAAKRAVSQGHFARGLDLERFAFEFHGILLSAHMRMRLLEDRSTKRLARKAMA